MAPDAFRAALDDLGLSQKDCARFLEIDARSVRRWATGEADVPRSVVLLFGLMRDYKITPAMLAA